MKPSPERDALLADVEELIDQAIEDTRSVTFELSPPILFELGLGSALEWLGEHTIEAEGIAFEFHDDGRCPVLDDTLAALIFRVCRELVLNVIKHARASKVSMSLSFELGRVCVRVRDDGVGMKRDTYERARKGQTGTYGLFSIQERLLHLGGTLSMESSRGKGVDFVMQVPVAEEKSTDRGDVS